MRGGLSDRRGNLLRDAAFWLVYTVLAGAGVYQNVVSSFVADRIGSSHFHWLAAASVIVAILVLGTILNLVSTCWPTGRSTIITFLVLGFVAFVISAYEGVLASRVPPG